MATEQDKVRAAMAAHSKIVVGDEKQRQDACMEEIKRICAQYDCTLIPTMILRPQGMEFFVETRAKPRDQRKKGQRNAPNKKG